MAELLETLKVLFEENFPWLAPLIAPAIIYFRWIEKTRRQTRESRIESKLDYLIELGGGRWNADTLPACGRSNLIINELSRLWLIKQYFVRSAERNTHLSTRRMNMLKLITTSAGRKFIYFIIASAVTYLNNRFGLNLNSDELFGIWGAAITLMQLEAHFNLKQFISTAINSLSGAAQTATTLDSGMPIQTVTAPPMTQEEATNLLKELTGLLQPIYDSVKSGKNSQATLQLLNAAASIRDYLKKVG